MPDKAAKFGILALTFLDKFHLKPSEAAFSRCARDNFRLEVVCDVISGANIGQVDVLLQSGDSISNGSRDIRLLHFVANDDDAVLSLWWVRRKNVPLLYDHCRLWNYLYLCLN